MKSSQLRTAFIDFFKERGHKHLPSASLIPVDDQSLLFINSGMAPMKDAFLGFSDVPALRAVTAQRCLRAGGKHNDLENVGYTARHHTFFEMLGNFSFGDYFKEQAIEYAWEFLTGKEYLGLAPRNIWVTVFGGGKLFGEDSEELEPDHQSYDCWFAILRKAGFSEEECKRRITFIYSQDNFWMMGPTGPCGPCSEIFYNQNADAERFEGEDEDKADSCLEIWNLVFMQYVRSASGEMEPLPKPCVDTGMGLERMSCVMQAKQSNYEIDLFADLLDAVAEQLVEAGAPQSKDITPSHRVIADHLRAGAFLIMDGVIPQNEGRGYVLRRIIRRALRHAYQLGATKPFLAKLLDPLILVMGDAGDQLQQRKQDVARWLTAEEVQFTKTLSLGMSILEKELSRLQQQDEAAVEFSGKVAFELYDTYGFPLDLTEDVLRTKGFVVDQDQFAACMQEQRTRSRASSKLLAGQQAVSFDGAATDFVGYEQLECEANVLYLQVDEKKVDEISAGSSGQAIFTHSPFYAHAGGQENDTGYITDNQGLLAKVIDVYKVKSNLWCHALYVEKGVLRTDSSVWLQVDAKRRSGLCRSHSSAHLVHSALREILGDEVRQKGSQVGFDQFRFDFSFDQPLSEEQLAQITTLANQQVRSNDEVQTEILSLAEAKEKGALAFFGEKYGDVVRMVSIDREYSCELCAGTHVAQAGDIGCIRIVNQMAVAAGVRRIEALVAGSSDQHYLSHTQVINELTHELKVPFTQTVEQVRLAQKQIKQLSAQVDKYQQQLAQNSVAALGSMVEQLADFRVLIAEVGDFSLKHIKQMGNELLTLQKLDAVLLVGYESRDAKLNFVTLVNQAKLSLSAKDWLIELLQEFGGKGGGQDKAAQGVLIVTKENEVKIMLEKTLKRANQLLVAKTHT